MQKLCCQPNKRWEKKMDTCDRNMYKNSEKPMYLELLMALYKNNLYIQLKRSK